MTVDMFAVWLEQVDRYRSGPHPSQGPGALARLLRPAQRSVPPAGARRVTYPPVVPRRVRDGSETRS